MIQVDGGLQFLNICAHFEIQLVERLRRASKLINKLIDFRAELSIEVAGDLTSHWDYSFLDFFIIILSLELVLYLQDLF